MTQYIKRLPPVFQTVTEKKFFDATIDQVFSKKDSDLLAGYLGRRNPGSYNPITDFYLPEPSKNRTWWQLEATAFARDADATKTNIFFYDDLLEHIEQYGGNTLNQDRLFESEYYSFGPPIDYDMFVNYQNYYWIAQGLNPVEITGAVYTDIAGQPSYTTPSTASPANFTLSTGMTVILADDPAYNVPHVVENLGGCAGTGENQGGIILVPLYPDYTSGSLLEFLPWDGTIELSTGRAINNYFWDALTWEVQSQPGNGDYLTIERGALDRNAWSRTNKWFHIDTINAVVAQTGTPFPENASRALRPIIQFIVDIPLYKSGTKFLKEIDFGLADSSPSTPITPSVLSALTVAQIQAQYLIALNTGSTVCFFNAMSNSSIYSVVIQPDNKPAFIPEIIASDGDIIFITEDGPYNGAQRGQTWYYSNGSWQLSFNDKTSTNQAPIFQLYDHNGVALDDPTVYPNSTFNGSTIFSYKLNNAAGATADPVLNLPIVYSGLGQITDIVFQNNLITDRYTYGTSTPIDGYYYFNTFTSPVLRNSWNLYDLCDCTDIIPTPPCNCIETSKQRVIDKFTVGYGSEYEFKLSVTPYGYVLGAGPAQPLADIIVSVNGLDVKPYDSVSAPRGYFFVEINDRIYVDLGVYLTGLLSTPQSVAPVVEIQTYTHGLLDPAAPGYYQIPQQLEANPTQLEVSDISAGDLVQQFTSIISNQIGFTGSAFGGPNNYRDSRKNESVGSYILQNVAPALKSMLVSSSDDLDFIPSIRFSQDEYTKFKNKYLTVALQLINQEFNPVAYRYDTVILNYWVTEILKTVNISKEFSNSFAYSYMAASGTPQSSETKTVPGNSLVTLTNYVDLTDPKNVMYIYDLSNNENLLLIGKDYTITSTGPAIQVQINLDSLSRTFAFYLYSSPLPTYIPSTPTKVGASNAYIPRIELDTTYAIPTKVIIGHDGSKTVAFNDYRDVLLLELEKRIYNFLQAKYRNEYQAPLKLENIKSGYFRKTRYARDEYLQITESYLNKWSAKNRANYRANDWTSASLSTPIGQLWKLYNYRLAVTASGAQTDLPGNWKGVFQYYYDTYCPDTRPWEMLGLSQKPSWWEFEYGSPVINAAGQQVWKSNSAGNNVLWADLEAGIIRQGPSAIFDPITLQSLPQETWARPGLSAIIPVTSAGEIIPVPILFNLAYSGNPYAPFDHFDDDWIYGDGGPVEQAWMSTSGYSYSVQEFLFLMKPGPYGELMWNTLDTEFSPGTIAVSGIAGPVRSSTNWQYVETSTWFRPKNENEIVHAEIVDGVTQVKFGYQTWISDRILFLGKNIADTFGQKIRTLDVNLANKLAGFTNKDTTDIYIESVTPGAASTTLIVPTTNYDVKLHKSPVVATYAYSGVIIRALADGTFVVYGYDLLNASFKVIDRTTDKLIDVSVGGTPVDFQYFEAGSTYSQGDIVRYNGVYYESRGAQVASKFDSDAWIKLKSLPVNGGISVSYKPVSAQTTTVVPYGAVLKTPQAVFDLLIGWGAYLESQGWQFDDVSQDTNILSDWLSSAKQFLFWLNTNWAPDASIQLSPLANKATLIVKRGYPEDIETRANGVYSILDKFGVAIPPMTTSTDRDGQMISASPVDLSTGGIYFLQVNTSETEHVLIFDNVTNFGDAIYSPLLRARQQRIRFNGFRSNAWYGKMEAPGYLIIDDQMVPNFDTIVESMRYFYDPNVTIDNPSLEDLGRHLIGYESKSYLDNLEVSNDVQYLFYQGAIRQKGTLQSFDKLFRSTKIQSDEIIEVYEEWALKLGDFGNTIEQVSTEFRLIPEQNTGDVIVARLNFVPSPIGSVRLINILNASDIYSVVPTVSIGLPDSTPPVIWADYNPSIIYNIGDTVQYTNIQGNPVYYSSTVNQTLAPAPLPGTSSDWKIELETRIAKAYIVLDSVGRIGRVGITDPGYGYATAPNIEILVNGVPAVTADRLYSVWQGEFIKDATLDNIVDIDIDQVGQWLVRPAEPAYSLEFPTTPVIDYPILNAGFVNFNDVDSAAFSANDAALIWGTDVSNLGEGNTIWIAKTFTEDWDVYKLVNSIPGDWVVKQDEAGNLLLLTSLARNSVLLIEPQPAAAINARLVNGYVSSINIILGGSGYTVPPTVTITGAATATAIITNGSVTQIIVTNGGSGYIAPPLVTIAPPGAGIAAEAVALILAEVDLNAGDIISPGGFFSSVPTISFVGECSVPADATVTLLNGEINDVLITNPGIGYTNPPTVVISPADNIIPAVLSPILDAAGGVVSVGVSAGSSGYTTAATISTAGGTTGSSGVFSLITDAMDGAVLGVTIINPGSGPNVCLTPQLWSPVGNSEQTDFGNMLILQQVVVDGINTNIVPENNYTLAFTPYTTTDYNDPGTWTDPDTLVVYNAYSLVTLDGTLVTSTDISTYEDFTDLLLYKSMKFNTLPLGLPPAYVSINDKIWIEYNNGLWNVIRYTSTTIPEYELFRVQGPLINSSLFENAGVFSSTGRELIQLPVYDPFKNILPGRARQNIKYMSLQDPAKYNVTSEDTLFSENINFSPNQVGQLWWDLSTARYTYYEQPIALDGSETELDNLVYRRDRWGQLFPGSTVDIYEWVQSDVPPANYTGSGIPRSTTSYVQISTSNRFTGVTETYFYFWVLGSTNLSNAANRTMAAIDVARLLQNPKSQGYSFFAPIQQTLTDNSYMFYNVQEILAYQGNNIQVQYRLSTRDGQEHTQWSFFREGDSGSYVTDQYWDKMVDSLCGYTDVLPESNEFTNSIPVDPTDLSLGQILPVPDPTLSSSEKYGISYRPRQGMFVNLQSARKILVQSANSLLQYISIRDDTPDWNANVLTNTYWQYTNWYAVGYEDATPTSVYTTLSDASIALSAGQFQVGDITQVTNGTPDGRYVLYAVVQPNASVPTLSLIEVGIENSAIKLLNTVYTTLNSYGLSVELRQLLNAFRTSVMIDEFVVDQNELFFSMLNYVVSEQKNPDWVFKSSYIYIKENNLPLVQSNVFAPDKIDSVISYINDAKPYHTQIRDYTRSYIATDIASGTASSESVIAKLYTLGQWDLDGIVPWDDQLWDSFELSETIQCWPHPPL